jgi:hypothetical protein
MKELMMCPHGKRLDECEECFDWLRRFEHARKANDAQMLEQLNREAETWRRGGEHERGQDTAA